MIKWHAPPFYGPLSSLHRSQTCQKRMGAVVSSWGPAIVVIKVLLVMVFHKESFDRRWPLSRKRSVNLWQGSWSFLGRTLADDLGHFQWKRYRAMSVISRPNVRAPSVRCLTSPQTHFWPKPGGAIAWWLASPFSSPQITKLFGQIEIPSREFLCLYSNPRWKRSGN